MGGVGWRLEGLFPLAADSGQERRPQVNAMEGSKGLTQTKTTATTKNQNKIKTPNPKANPALTSSLALSLGGVFWLPM